MSEKKFCKSCEYYYSEMFTCPICYGEQRERERIIELVRGYWSDFIALGSERNGDPFAEFDEQKFIALIKGETE